jgi:LCP family protein required for cell wall assembly
MTNDYQQPRQVRFSTEVQGSLEPEYRPAPQDKNPRNRWRIWIKITAIIVLILVILLALYAGVLVRNVAKISTVPLSLSPLVGDGMGRTNVLLLGVGDEGHAGQNLSDTIMLMSANKSTKQNAQISIPRDLRVYIPGYGYGKINSANAKGGVDLAGTTVSNMLDVPINYYVTTNFSGLVGIIDSVGGLDVDVAQRLYDADYPCDDNQYRACGVDIQTGRQHMDGATALKYARCRKGTCGNDYGRAMRQQEVINLLTKKIITWQTILNPKKLIPLTNALSGAIQTNMGVVQMGEFGLTWMNGYKNNPIMLVLSTFPGNYLVVDSHSSDLLPIGGSFSTISERVQGIFTLPTLPSDIPN